MEVITKSARVQCLYRLHSCTLERSGIMFEKLFGLEELHKELEGAREQILNLQGELLRKDLMIKAQIGKIEELQADVTTLKEALDIKKFSSDRFGRISRVTERNLNILQELMEEGLSYSAIAERMVGYTGEDWSKSTVHCLLKRYRS